MAGVYGGFEQLRLHSLISGGKFALGVTVGVCTTILAAVFWNTFGWDLGQNDTIFGAIVGGFVAGLAGLIATLTATYFSLRQEQLRERSQREAAIYSCLIKVNDIYDSVVKNYQHCLDGQKHLSLFVGEERFPKPLSGFSDRITFSIEEKSTFRVSRNTSLSNRINDAQGICDQFLFLKTAYDRKFDDFQHNTLSQSTVQAEGKEFSGEVEIPKLMVVSMIDLRDHLISFLYRAVPELENIRQENLRLLEDEFGRKVEYQLTTEPAQAPNLFDGP